MNEVLNFRYPSFIYPAIQDQRHYVVVPAGRQIGKTYNFVSWICSETLKLGCNSLWVDTVQGNISKYIDRYFRVILKPIWRDCHWYDQKKVLRLPKGCIDFGSAQEPQNLEGFNYKRVVLNEAGHILKKESLWYNTLQPMIKADDNQTRIIGTPKGRGLFEEMYNWGLDASKEDWGSYRFTVYDSPYWTLDQIESKKEHIPEAIWKQEYLAEFNAFAGMIYPDFMEERHVRDVPEKEYSDIYFVVLDNGWEHPTACILAKEDIHNNIWVMDEFREKHLSVGDIRRRIDLMLMQNGISFKEINTWLIDPASRGTQQTSTQSIYEQLNELGLPFVVADNDVMAGISRVTSLFRSGKLFISPRCEKMIAEVKDYHWKEYSNGGYGENPKPYKIGDDLVDTLRYLVQSRPDYLDKPVAEAPKGTLEALLLNSEKKRDNGVLGEVEPVDLDEIMVQK